MTDPATEVVGIVADRAQLDAAVAALVKSGFDKTDLSLLSSHDSLEVADEAPAHPWRDAITALAGEYKIVGPLIASGGIFLVGGPVGEIVAAIIAAGVTGIAAKEVVEEVVDAPESEDFTRALDAGELILWVRAETPERQTEAERILADAGAKNVHRTSAGA